MSYVFLKWKACFVTLFSYFLGFKSVKIESFEDGEAAGEGASLANWSYDTFKKEKKPRPTLLALGTRIK